MSDSPKKGKTVSYSQFAKWSKCPNAWQLDYIKGLKINESSLVFSFGDSIHEVLQEYVETLYTKGMLKASTMNLKDLFTDKFLKYVAEKMIDHTDEDLQEFLDDGIGILDDFISPNISLKYFPPDKYEFIGVEKELNMTLLHNTELWGYIDLVLKEKATGRIKIYDFKTARQGWNERQMSDETKTAQLVLYKAIYSKKFNVSTEMIDVEFFILKRKIYSNSNYKQTHIQIFTPDSSVNRVNQVIDKFTGFLTECFHPNGSYNEGIPYPKIPGKGKENCKYCHHKGTNCDAVADVKK